MLVFWSKECAVTEGLIGEEQGAFKSGRGYVDQILHWNK